MAFLPKDHGAAIAALAEQVDKLTGQLAALTAYVAHMSPPPLAERDVRSMQGLAQKSVSLQLTVAGNPGLAASEGVEKIRWMAQNIQAIRSAGSSKAD